MGSSQHRQQLLREVKQHLDDHMLVEKKQDDWQGKENWDSTGDVTESQGVESERSGRFPLLDCTNTLSLGTIGGEVKDHSMASKGQWKRRARMKTTN